MEPSLAEIRIPSFASVTAGDPITLRDALPSDRAFLLALYTSTRADEFALFGWPVETERAFMQMQFEAQRGAYERMHPDARCQIIELRRCPIGRLWLAQDARSLSVLDISLIADLRGQGIGTDCLRRVQRHAAAARLDVELQVVPANPARRLYERLGFRNVGEGGVRQAMVWKPSPASPAARPPTAAEDEQA
jgi:ribosomal protein S18 acetylase RimI-like enzyme